MVDEIKRLEKIVEDLNIKHKEDFKNITEPVLVIVQLSNGENIFFEIGNKGIIKYNQEPDISDKIILTFKDLEKIERNKKLIMPYLMSGKIKLRGNIKRLTETIKNIF
ncbi:hypothetical protein JCM14244_05100 [Venenivibrio stagnispumantis]|uniref:SCP2 domain-containing protein n=1 Tax=Venenivibrio stagnispumantis TaxID=407998 RepID=A0AA46AFK7_9AQUI|nr:hypothetical protein [Venenivibrio stagnispumantis]MCW4572684.1 hypothetical protein [Venenivibrio stagnispumantis]SMP21433.1 hypothetical protein SAMN06264868_12315 [Venenivibrio stagnispumantis]